MSEEDIRKFVQNNIKGSPGDTIAVWDKMLRDGQIPHVNVQDTTFINWTAIIYQARYGTEEGMEWLLTRDPPANPDIKNIYGDTALMLAVYFDDNPAMVRMLLEYKADRSIRYNGGDTPLSYAKKWNRDPAIIDLLENYYPEINR